MIRTVALDTTSNHGSIALLEDESVLEEVPLYSSEGFSTVLFDHVEQLLQRHGWPIDSVHCFAAAAGPGSFTGVRIGLTAVKGLAEATGARPVGVSNLRALASYGSSPLRGVVMDARRGEVYGAVYDAALREVIKEAVLSFPKWLAELPQEVGEILSPDFSAFRPAMVSEIPVVEQRIIASAVGRLAYVELKQGDDPGNPFIEANYVRRSDAELFWVDRPR